MKSTPTLGAAAFAVAALVTSFPAAAQAPPDPPTSPDTSTTGTASVTFGSPAEATVGTDAPADEKPTRRRDDSVHVGVLGGVGFPRPLGVEAILQLDGLVLFGAEYSALPTVDVSGVNTSLWAVAGDIRVFPARSGFFVGLRAGRQHLAEQGSIAVTGVGTFSAGQTADTTFVNPRMGFLWTWRPFALGIDAGVQIPVSTTAASTVPAQIQLPAAVTEATHLLSQQVLPTIDLLRIGVVM
ncbi:MAG TPA: hypothetical protein VGG39_19590 [Polyangiaceae bacterium]